MALSCGLTSVRGNRGEIYENEPLVHQKPIKKKKKFQPKSSKGAGEKKVGWKNMSPNFARSGRKGAEVNFLKKFLLFSYDKLSETKKKFYFNF
jgi:hypothetical protein